ncbi:MAG: citrate transporter [Methylococcaceae bacterium]|nr:MAG: citrate transporter [Methylococcaceae bacterium]
MPILPLSPIGFIVLAIFVTGIVLIILEVRLGLDKFKPALLMMSSMAVLGVYYLITGEGPERFHALKIMQAETKENLFALITFMAFMWMMVEILDERNVFGALTAFLMSKGFGARGIFWATGFFCALLSPFISSLTTSMVFGHAIRNISTHQKYTHLALCNIIVASNSGVWFVGTSTSLMVILAGKLTLSHLLLLLPASLCGWLLTALVLHVFYLRRLEYGGLIKPLADCEHHLSRPGRRRDDQTALSIGRSNIKPGGIALTVICLCAIVGAVLLNLFLQVDIEFAIGTGLGVVMLYTWVLKLKGVEVPVEIQLQKVQWSTLMYYIGIITGMAALSHVGWLSYIAWLYEHESPTFVNVLLGLVSSFIDNNLLEAAAIMSNPALGVEQWTLNTLMVGVGGSLTVVGSAAGVMTMSIERSYTFAAHLKFLPAVLVNFFGSFAIWYLQYEWLR